MPAIIRSLGYNPLPLATTLAGPLIRRRTSLGLLQPVTAGLIRMDRGTLARWERGEKQPFGSFLTRVEKFLASTVPLVSGLRRAG
jgi:transcriptional regulator with XRE-family HTH domain